MMIQADEEHKDYGRLVIITEAGIMNALQLFQRYSLSQNMTMKFFANVTQAVMDLNKKNIIHHDLKPENILITKVITDASGSVTDIKFCLIDLGMSVIVEGNEYRAPEVNGTIGYHPPEIWHEHPYDTTADTFMLGITFLMLLQEKNTLKYKVRRDRILEQLHEAKDREHAVGQALLNAAKCAPLPENVAGIIM